jgi:predicted RNase H-like HicB family nuclease
MRTHVFAVHLEQNDDGRWSATCPALPGCATWGATKEIALRFIQEAAEAYVNDLIETGDPLPAGVTVLNEPAVSVTV